ncbi:MULTISPECIES: CocE/NonD family hydrolase [unclassified Amycolatopsis]|uniref:CocE/NonD family hydrolase n=1 Tax=Amycolatopsis TaxID=1813 RepID=UPI00026269F2|nr:CocE/NonD family hydrolase [Amycolatopsis sp. ATCC 39116]
MNPPKEFDVIVVKDVRIPSSSPGVSLAADIYMPLVTKPCPAVVTMHSVRKDAMAGMGVRRFLRYFAKRGYASLLVDTRGTGSSDGEAVPLLSPSEGEDGAAVVEWIADQSWCDGAVGMWGSSHGGMLTLATASLRPPSLKAVVAMLAATDIERDLIHPAHQRGGIGYFGRFALLDIIFSMMPALRAGDDVDGRRWKARASGFTPLVLDAWRNKAGDPVWRERAVDIGRIEVPTFCVAGWRDVYCDNMIQAYEELSVPKKLLAGPWLHTFVDASPREPVSTAELTCDWWDRWLRDAETGNSADHDEMIYLEGTRPGWYTPRAWPPPDSVVRSYAVMGVDELAPVDERGATGEDEAIAAHQNDSTVGALTGLWTTPTAVFGYPLDQTDDDRRSMAFTSDALAEDLIITGRPVLRLVCGEDTTAVRCVAKLTDVDEAGRSRAIAVGVAGLTPGTRDEVTVTMNSTCYRVARRHRLRLVLADNDFPRLWPVNGPSCLAVASANRLSGAKGHWSRLELPILEESTLRPVAVPRPAKSTGGTSRVKLPDPVWETSRDHVSGGAAVRIDTTEGAPYESGGEHLLIIDRTMRATVSDRNATSTEIKGSGRASVRTESGDDVIVEARVTVEDDQLRAEGLVEVNGIRVITRHWTA